MFYFIIPELYFDSINCMGEKSQIIIRINLTDFLFEASNDIDMTLLSFTIYKEVLYSHGI